MANLKDGARAIDRLSRSLRASDGLSGAYAEAVLREAKHRAASKPTPQARMAASVMGVRGGTILPLAGGDPAAVSAGSEWGSNIYRQFGPRNDGGYWLMPSTESLIALTAADRYLQQMVDSAVRRF